MKAVAILLCMYMVSMVSALPITSKPLENNPDHLVWEALLTIDTHRPDDRTRKIPKSIFITPNLNESKGNCPPDHKLGPDGQCYKTLKIDPLVILKTQIESLLNKNRTATTEYDEDYDYSEYGESTESMNSHNGQYTVPFSIGFASDDRIPQEPQRTTLPNLNRVVKDSHITPGSIISSEKQNQPFLVSTTSFDLGAEEDDSIESKSETSSSAATTSNTISSSEKPTTSETRSSAATVSSTTMDFRTSSTPNADTTTIQNVQPQSTVATTSTDEIMNDGTTSMLSGTNDYSISSMASLSSTEAQEPVTATVSSMEILETDADVTTIANKDAHVIVITTEKVVSIPANDSISISTEASESVMSTPIEDVKSIDNSQSDITEASIVPEIVTVTQPGMVTVQNSMNNSIETIETQNESSKQLSALSQIIVNEPEEKLSTVTPTVIDISSTEKKEIYADDVVKVMSEKLSDVSVTKSNESTEKVIIVQARTENQTESSTYDSKNESYEVIDAIFVPAQSELLEELDSADVRPKYRFENASSIDDELNEAEIGKESPTNIELVDGSDELSRENKNFSDHLAEELFFQEANLVTPKSEEMLTNDTIEVIEASQQNDSVSNAKDIGDEEIRVGDPLDIEINAGSEVTTEQPIDYDSKEIKFPTEGSILAGKSNAFEAQLPFKEAVPFNIAPALVSREGTYQPTSVSVPPPSIYSTFLNRLKLKPPVVDLSESERRQSDTFRFSHNPFDLRTALRNRRPTQPVTSRTMIRFPDDDDDRSFGSTGIVKEPIVRGKSLQLGINCYLRSLVNKQQFSICDNA